jgi:hypothetical protein
VGSQSPGAVAEAVHSPLRAASWKGTRGLEVARRLELEAVRMRLMVRDVVEVPGENGGCWLFWPKANWLALGDEDCCIGIDRPGI